MKTFFANVISNEKIAEDTQHITFSVDSDVQFTAGQFFNLKLQNTDEKTKEKMPFIFRGYSVASSPNKLPKFELCVKVVKFEDRETGEEKTGIGSGFLGRLQENEKVEFMGPFGHFVKKDVSKNTIMLATGTGIAPMRAICEELSEKNFPTKTILLYGVSNSEFVCYHDFFQELANKNKNFEYKLFISREEENEISKKISNTENIKSGRITLGLEKLSEKECENTDFLICGNPAMVKQVRSILREEKNVDKKDIVTEQF